MTKKLINLAKIDFAGNAGAAPGPAPAPSADADVVLRDYDGSVVASYTKEEFAALTELPAPPEHEGLTFQEWNWSLADAQAYCAQYDMVDIGATYITSDGKTRVYITLEEGRTSPTLGLAINGSVDVDWGDGSAHNVVTGQSLTTVINTIHTYSTPGDYIITITPADGTRIIIWGTSATGSKLLWAGQSSTSINQAYNNAIRAVFIGVGITEFSQYAFCNCYNLTKITLPKGVVTLSLGLFSNCYSLTSVTIPQGVTSIVANVFVQCRSLKSVTIPRGVTSIGGYVFSGCYGIKSVKIPDGVTRLENYLFSNCYSLTSVIIPQGVTYIANSAFQYCYSLTSVTIPQGVTYIGNNAFQDCRMLQHITIPDSVTLIGSFAFTNCVSLTNLIIPQGITTISASAFQNCYSMAYYRFEPVTPPTIQGNTFNAIPADAIIYVPAESVEAYKAATNWSAYASQIQPMP